MDYVSKDHLCFLNKFKKTSFWYCLKILCSQTNKLKASLVFLSCCLTNDRWVASFMNLMEDLFVKEATQWVLEQLRDFLSQLMWVFSCYLQHTMKVKKNWILIWSSSSGWVIFQFLRHEVTLLILHLACQSIAVLSPVVFEFTRGTVHVFIHLGELI